MNKYDMSKSLERFVISKRNNRWHVNSSTYGIDYRLCNGIVVNGLLELVTPFNAINLMK